MMNKNGLSFEMQEFYQISIIIPAYNAAPYIERCLNSIFQLSFEVNECEIIVIDDCSTDDTLKILQTIAEEHPNMVVLHQEKNQRQGAARNKGLEIARGEYVAFCDADDCIEPDFVDILRHAIKTKCKICMYDCYKVYENGENEIFSLFDEHIEPISGIELFEAVTDDRINERGAPWGYLYNTSYLRSTGILFRENRIYEDADVVYEWVLKCDAVSVIHLIGYSYILTQGSSTLANKTAKTLADAVYLEYRKLRLIEIYKKECPNFYKRMRRIIYNCVANNLNILITNRSISYSDFISYLDHESISTLLNMPYKKFRYKAILKYPAVASAIITILHYYYRLRKYLK